MLRLRRWISASSALCQSLTHTNTAHVLTCCPIITTNSNFLYALTPLVTIFILFRHLSDAWEFPPPPEKNFGNRHQEISVNLSPKFIARLLLRERACRYTLSGVRRAPFWPQLRPPIAFLSSLPIFFRGLGGHSFSCLIFVIIRTTLVLLLTNSLLHVLVVYY